MNLSEIERNSAVWKKIEKHLAERIDVCRRKNDGDLDQFETARLRGEIQAYKRIMAIGEIQPPIETNGTE